MKAMVVSPVGGRVPPSRGILHSSIGINGTRRDLEAEEVAAYLTKLRSLVPDMPRKRKLSKLEVIQRVIEYICDLQTTLEETNVHHESSVTKTTPRQPLQPLLNATTTIPTTTTTSTTTMTGMVAERWPVSANELQWGPGRCKLVLVDWRVGLWISTSWHCSCLFSGNRIENSGLCRAVRDVLLGRYWRSCVLVLECTDFSTIRSPQGSTSCVRYRRRDRF